MKLLDPETPEGRELIARLAFLACVIVICAVAAMLG